MHIRSIKLRDWKAYESATFEFPDPGSRKNVVLIGGKNGFGKTTLFEALALGLFGRDGLPLVLRAGVAGDEQRLSQNFRSFIERALFSGALLAGRASCSIELKFIDEFDEPIEIMRRWFFNDGGKLKQGESAEELRILEGKARNPVSPGRNETDRDAWYRDWVSRRFLPTSLASFFLFDGEAASSYAERDMGEQVRQGIAGLLGLNWLEQLAKDLRAYAARKRAELPRGASTDAILKLDAEIAAMEAELADAEVRREALEAEFLACSQERDALTREFAAGFGGGTRARMEELVRDRADCERQFSAAESGLRSICDMDLPLALSGQKLREKVKVRLDQERQREQWEAATSQREERTSQVVELLDDQLPRVVPPLLAEQALAVRAAVQKALERLWFPPPDGVADSFRHPHARSMQQRAIDRLVKAQSVSAETVNGFVDSMNRLAAKLRELNSAINQTESTSPQTEEKRERLRELNAKISELDRARGEVDNRKNSRASDIQQKRSEHGRLSTTLDQTQKPVRLAARADEVADMLDGLIGEAWPTQTQEVARQMTSAIQSMAHRNDYLREVEIDDDGAVELLAPDGRDLRQLDLSAGEKQIFTQALFSAVATVSERQFPLVVDTPLGRLDDQHRLNVLKHLAARDGQVILISTDTEVVNQYLDAIRTKIAKTYVIQNTVRDGIARSWVEEGYFEGQEI